jgi:hypothetical protein
MPSRTIIRTQGGVSKNLTVNRDREAVVKTISRSGRDALPLDRTARVHGSDRAGESRPLLSKVVGASEGAYSLRDLNDKQGKSNVIKARKAVGGSNVTKVFRAKDIHRLEDWAINVLDNSFNRTASTLKSKQFYDDFTETSNLGTINGYWTGTTKLSVSATGGARTSDKSVTLLHNDTEGFSLGHYEVTFNVTQSGGDDINSAVPFSSRNRIELVTRDTDTTADSNDNLNKQRFAVSKGFNKFRFTLFDDGTTPNKEPSITLIFYRKALFNVEISNIQLRHFTNADGDANAHVETWYDQSGNSRHATQTDTSKQGLIVENGTYLEGVKFNGSSQYYDFDNDIALSRGTPLSVFCLQDAVNSTNDFTLGSQGSNRGISFKNNKVSYYFSTNTISIDAPTSVNGMTQFAVIHDGTETGTNVRAYRNGAEIIDSSPDSDMGSKQHAVSINYLGTRNTNDYFTGKIKELIIYTKDQTANRPAIEANNANQYNLTLS